MNKALTIAKREFNSLFFSPIAYVVLGLFTLGVGLIFFAGFDTGAPAEMQRTFGGVVWLLAFLAPAISMRLLSEELRSGTLDLLISAPISDGQVIFGKWLGAMGFVCVLLSPLLVLIVTIDVFGNPEYGPIFTGLLGLLFVAGLYMAIGTFASTASENQIIAFVLAIFIINVLTTVTQFVREAAFVGEQTRGVIDYVNVFRQYEAFGKGVIDLSNFMYFATVSALFLFLAVKLLESRRWR